MISTRYRLGIAIAAAIAMSPLGSGVASAATAEIGGGSNTFFVHVSGLASKTDKCLVWLDNRPDPVVGSPAEPDAGGVGFVANYDGLVIPPGRHTVRVACTDANGSPLLDQQQDITVGPAQTPSGDSRFSGTYTMSTNVESQTWVVTPCGDGCARVSASGRYIQNWTADAHLVDGAWVMTVDRPDAVMCIRQWGAGTAHYSIDASLTGGSVTVDVAPGNICNKPPETLPPEGIALTKVG